MLQNFSRVFTILWALGVIGLTGKCLSVSETSIDYSPKKYKGFVYNADNTDKLYSVTTDNKNGTA